MAKHNLSKAVQMYLYGYRKANNGPVYEMPKGCTAKCNELQPGCNVEEIARYLAQPVHFGKARVTRKVAGWVNAVEAYFNNVNRYKGIKTRLPRTYTVVKIAKPRKVVPVRMVRGLRAF